MPLRPLIATADTKKTPLWLRPGSFINSEMDPKQPPDPQRVKDSDRTRPGSVPFFYFDRFIKPLIWPESKTDPQFRNISDD